MLSRHFSSTSKVRRVWISSSKTQMKFPCPPEEVKIQSLRVEPYPDGKRLRVYLEVDPFQKKPNAELTITDKVGDIASNVSILESMTRKMELTMHLRGVSQNPPYTLLVKVYYFDTPADAPEEPSSPVESSVLLVVDQKYVIFRPPEIQAEAE